MKNNVRRLMAMLLCLCLTSGSFLSCSDAGQEEKDEASAENAAAAETPAAEEVPAEEEEERILPDLPEADYDGYEFRMIGKGKTNSHWKSFDLSAEELNGEPINDAVYNRNVQVGDTYNVKFLEIDVASYDSQEAEVTKSVRAGSDEYDMAALKPQSTVSSFISNGYVMNLYDIPYMDLTKPWYDQSSISGLSLAGNLYCVMGDMLTMDDDATGAIFFNKMLAEDNDLPNLYDMVREGTWTIDRMIEYATLVARDANGDGRMSEKDDVFGAETEISATMTLLSGSGKTMITKDENDIPVFTATDEAYISMYDKVVKIQNNWDITIFAEALTGYSDVWVEAMDLCFQSNRVLFNICWLNRASLFRGMETDFGILPIPKYDETQEKHYSLVSMFCANCITIPKTVSDFERTGVIIEALSAESMYSLKPAYYDKTLKSKEMRDVESVEMLDLIFANRVFDLGYMFQWGSVDNHVTSCAGTNGKDTSTYSSTMARAEKSITKAIQKTIDALEDEE